MKQFEEVFLDILKAGMWGVRPQVPEGFDEWVSVVRLAKSQSVLGVVGNGLLSDAELSQRVPKDLRDKVKKFVMSSMMTHNLLNGTLVKVVSTLRDNGVESVLLKGQGLARNYPQPELRQCGDIDLYVGLENGERVREILAPIAEKVDEAERVNVGKHYHVTMPGGVEVEVHRLTDLIVSSKRNVIYQAASDKGTSTGLVTYDFGGTAVNTPADDFNAFFIFNHLFHHFLTSGIGLRQFCDWMMFLHARKGRLDLEYLGKLLSDMDMMKPWKVFGCVLVKLLGMPAKHQPGLIYLRHVPLWKVHAFTAVQLTCLVLLWAIKASAAAVVFPMMVSLFPGVYYQLLIVTSLCVDSSCLLLIFIVNLQKRILRISDVLKCELALSG